MGTLYLCGAGNSEGVRLALVINRAEQRWEHIVLLDDDPAKLGEKMLGVEIAGPLDLLAKADPATDEVASFVARTTARRAAVRAKLEPYGIPFATLIHPGVDTLGAKIENDVIVYEHATISPEVTLGQSSVVFMGAVVGHESQLESCCICAAGSVLNARVELATGVYVGTNASILPEVSVGEGATIGANTVVISEVPAGATVVGVPGEIMMSAAQARASMQDAREDQAEVEVDPELLECISALWCELLGRESISPGDNFFEVGGTSLLALQMTQRLRAISDCPLAPTDAFRFPTVQALAAHLSAAANGSSSASSSSRASRRALARRNKRQAG